MREEYKAIIDAGLVLQLDDPAIAENWDQINPEPSVEDKRFPMAHRGAQPRDARAAAGRIRFHLCWGSWHGPHTTDIPMRDIVDVMLEVNAGGYSFEAGNARHEHEWRVWQDVKLPDGKVLIPGVVSHATNVASTRAGRRAHRALRAVGREKRHRLTDCGLGGRVHPQIAWAKLGALARARRSRARSCGADRRPSVAKVRGPGLRREALPTEGGACRVSAPTASLTPTSCRRARRDR